MIDFIKRKVGKMILRRQYLQYLKQLQDKQLIKVITGVRRCGKSTLLQQFQEELKKQGVGEEQILFYNFERLENERLLDYHKLHDTILSQIRPGMKTYVFLDEVQLVDHFQKAVDSLYVRPEIDLYLTGSNARLLSGELATLLSGRFIEIQMLPFSFREYIELTGEETRQAWKNYFTWGGFPYLPAIGDESIRYDYLQGIYTTILLKDLVERKKIQDVELLESVIRFLMDNVGNLVSFSKIAGYLVSHGRKTSSQTIERYVRALEEAFFLYKASRYDIRGKKQLKSLEKYYLVDMGFRRLLVGNRRSDIGHILENIVYLELLRRGYRVFIGKIDSLEVDFIAERNGQREYYQVSASVLDPHTFDREITPLKQIQDNYPKAILTLDELSQEEDGIRQINIVDFLLHDGTV